MKQPVTFSERPLPEHEGVLPLWPGEQVDRLFVRRGPAEGERQTHAPQGRPTG